MLTPAARMMSSGPYGRQTIRKLRFLMTDNTLTPQAIRRLGHRYQPAGLDGALFEKQRPGAAEVLDANQKQRIIAMVCSDPPEGRARWTTRTCCTPPFSSLRNSC
jgi:beta-phosphoglucomutase-like phosphatase (HAD superfamily)